ncbi:zinc finger, CCHC-type containing protein [Tanacetum coccineum]
MGDANPIRTLGDYSKPSHEGYRNTIELPVGNNVVPLRSDTIRLVQNGCSFHGLRSEDPNQHLKDFLKLVDSLDLDGENRERTRLRLFQFSLRDQASNWLERLPAGSITTWEDLTTRFLAQFFPPRRTAKLRNDILMFQQHQGESLSEAWTRFKDLLQKVPHHGIDRWLQIQIFYDHVSFHLKCEIDRAAGGKIRNKNPDESWEIIKNLTFDDHEGWNDAKEFVKPVKAISTPQPTSKTPDRRLLELEDQINFLLKGSSPTPRPSSTHVPQAYTKATDIRLSLASHSYIYPLGIAEDVLVDVTGYVYPVDFMILDIKEDEKRPFILGTPFLTTTKAMIKFDDKGTITLRSGKSKISLHRIPDSPCMTEKGVKNNIKPIAPTMIVNRLVLEWEEMIKLHLEREMEFNQWRSKNFKGKHPTLITTKGGIEGKKEVT